METPIWHCLSLECQKRLTKAGWKPVKEKPMKINLDTAMEDLDEVDKLIRQTPSNIKRDGRW